MAKELKNSIIIDGIEEPFNINAVEAERVQNKLKINNIDNNGSIGSTVEYNGFEEKEISIVPSSGGKFTGLVKVPSRTEESNPIEEDDVLNYYDINEFIVKDLSRASILYDWTLTTDPSTGDGVGKLSANVTHHDTIQGISLVKGLRSNLEAFATYNKNAYDTYIDAIENNKSTDNLATWVGAYLYICNDGAEDENPGCYGNIYLGSCEHSNTYRLATSANKLDNRTTIRVNLSRTDANENGPATFNGLELNNEINPGIFGTLSAEHGGTGKSSLSAVTVGKATQLENNCYIKVDLGKTDDNAMVSFNGTENNTSICINPGVHGTLPLDNGGTGAKTWKGAEFYIHGGQEDGTNQMAETQYPVEDSTEIILAQAYPSSSTGFFHKKPASKLLAYIKSKLGFTDTSNVLSVTNGGTGKTDLADVTVGKATQFANNCYIAVDLGKTTVTGSSATEQFNGKQNTIGERIEPGVFGTLPIARGGTNATTAAAACSTLISNNSISPKRITTTGNQYYTSTTNDFGINLQNSDIIGINGLFFEDPVDSKGEGINFRYSTSADTWDRLYSVYGTLYYTPNVSLSSSHPGNRYTVYHSGSTIPVANGGTGQTNLGNVTVGKADTVKVYYGGNYSAKITISGTAPSGTKGDIWIKPA